MIHWEVNVVLASHQLCEWDSDQRYSKEGGGEWHWEAVWLDAS